MMSSFKKIKLGVLSCFLFLALQGYAQDTPETLIQKFFDDYEQQGSSMALDNLYETNPWMQGATEAIGNLKEKMNTLTEEFVGKCHGYDLIAKKEVSSSYVLFSYLAKYDRQPIRFTFQFYKPADTWKIYSFKYDGNMDTELEESVRLDKL